MEQSEIERKLRESVGDIVVVTFGGHTETVFICSVDPDGFLCRPQSASPGDTSAEFWIPYDEVTSISGMFGQHGL